MMSARPSHALRRVSAVVAVTVVLTGMPTPSAGRADWPELSFSSPATAVRSVFDGVVAAVRNGAGLLAGRLGAGDAHAAPAPAPDDAPTPAQTEARDAAARARREGRPVELASRRDERTTVYVNPDGTETAELSAGPIRVRDGAGWRAIDTTLALRDGRVRPNATAARLSFSAGGDTDLATLLDADGGEITMRWPVTLPAPRLDGATATYADAYPGADLVLRATSLGFEQTLVVRERPDRDLAIRIPLRLRGVTMTQGPGGGLVLTGKGGHVVASAPAPRMWGAKIDPRSLEPTRAADVPVEIDGAATDPTLVLRPDPAFLADPSVTYPVTIDPSPSLNNVGDTFVQNDYTSNQDASTDLKAGTYNGGANIARSYIKFDHAPIVGKHVLSATLKLYEYHSYSCTARPVNIYRTTANWSPSTIVWSNAPAHSGTVFATANVAYGYSTSCPDNWVTFTGSLATAAQLWADGGVNYGLQVRAADEGDSYGWKRFYSENNGTYVPSMVVSYNSDPTIGSGTLGPQSNTKAADLTPTFTGKYNDVDAGDSGYVKYEVVRDSDSAAISSGNGTTVSPGGTSTWTIPTGKMVDGVRYRWRAQAWDGVDASAWTAWFYYTPDLTAPTGRLTAPAADAVVSGTVTVTATPTDAVSGVGSVDFYVTSKGVKSLVATDTSSSGGWTASLDTTRYADGPAVVSAEYSDLAGNDACCAGGASVAVVVANSPGGAMPWTAELAVDELSEELGSGNVLLGAGRFTTAKTDTTMKGRGPDAAVTRYYDSGSPSRTRLGSGWRTNLDESLVQERDGSLHHLDPAGRDGRYSPVTAPGLLATSWNNTAQTGTPAATRVDPTVNFNWTTAAPQAGVNADSFSTRWTGLVDVPTTGDWTFYTTTDDGARLTVDGAWLVDDWTNHAATERSGTTTLTAGKHVVQLDYYDSGSYASAVLSWAGPGVAKQVIPAANLTHVTGYTADTAALHESVTIAADGLTRTLTTADRDRHTFLADGRLLSVRDRNGNGVVTSFDTSGRPNKLCFADPNAADACGTAVQTLAYDTSGRLSTVTDASSAVTRYGYDASGRLTTVTDALNRAWTYGYDASGRVSSVGNPLAEAATVAYDAIGRVTSLRSARQVAAAQTGTTVAYSGDIVTVTSANANALAPAGAGTTYALDPERRVTSVVDPLGRTTSRTWDASSNVLTEVDGLNRTTTYTHDTKGNVLTKTLPSGAVTTYTYDADGDLLTETDAEDRVTTHTYDAAGNHLTETAPGGAMRSWNYDAYGQVTSEVDPRGHATTYTYDTRGNRLTETNPLGNLTTRTYNAAGDVLTVRDALLRTTTTTYDLARNVSSRTTPAGRKTTFTYDSAGRLLSEVGPRGNVAGADPAIDRTSYTWWPDSRAKTQTNAENETTSFYYDADGNLTTTVDAMAENHVATFDLAGQRTSSSDPEGATTSIAYDAAGQQVSVTTPTGTTTTGYDVDGNVVAEHGPRTDAGGTPLKTTRTYDSTGRMLTQTTPAGNVSGATPGSYTTTFTYTPEGDPATVTDPLGRVTQYGHDAARNLVSTTDPSGATTTVVFDAAGRETQRRVPAAITVTGTGTVDAAATSVAYVDLVADNAGTVTAALDWTGTADLDLAIVDASGTVVADAGDHTARPELATYAATGAATYRARVSAVSGSAAYTVTGNRPSVELTTLTYNAAGEIVTEVDPNGTTDHTYDADGDILATELPDGRTKTLSLDTDGRMVSLVDPTGTQTFTYDNVDRYLTATDQAGVTTTYGYDDNGEQTSVSSGTVNNTYTRDGSGRTLAMSGTTSASFAYSDSVNQTGVTYGNGEVDEADYDGDGRVTNLRYKVSSTATPYLSVGHTYDEQGNLVTITDSTATPGTVTATFGYDELDRLTNETALRSSGTWSASYGYDAQGNRTSATRAGATTGYTYDASGQLVARTAPGGAVTLYRHDAEGRLTGTSGAETKTYTWSSDSYLTGVTDASGTVSFVYDTSGTPMSRTSGGVTTTYSYEDGRLKSEKTPTTTVSYGYDDKGAPLTVTTSAGTYQYHYDHHGSVIALTDSAHAVVVRYVYDAWGNVIEETGDAALRAASAYTFLGRLKVRRQAETGMYLMGARFYDPGLGRFVSRDPIRADDDLSPYVYAGDNPVAFTDSTGLLFPDSAPGTYKPPPAPKPTRKAATSFRASAKVKAFIKDSEKWRAVMYDNDGAPGGNCTIGYGHLIHPGRCTDADRRQWGTISLARGNQLFEGDVVKKGESVVKRFITAPLFQREFDALTSFAYNTGGKFLNPSVGTLGKTVNAKRYADVPRVLMMYNKASGQTLRGLTRRRCEEGKMFAKGIYSNFGC